MNRTMVPRYWHVLICCFLLCCFVKVSPFIFPIFPAPTFPPFSAFGVQFCACLFHLVVIQFSHFSGSHICPIFPLCFSMSLFLFL